MNNLRLQYELIVVVFFVLLFLLSVQKEKELYKSEKLMILDSLVSVEPLPKTVVLLFY